MLRYLCYGSLLAGLCTAAAIPAWLSAAEPAAAQGTVAVKLISWEDTQKLIAAQKDKVVVVDLWSTSCVECVREFPHLVELHEKYGKQGVTCVSVSFDYIGVKSKPPEFYKERVLKFLKERKATLINVLATDPSDEIYEKIELAGVPAVYVYGRDGKLVKRFDNESIKSDDEAFTYKDVTKLVEELIAKK